MELQLEADISPNQELGGLNLRSSIKDLEHLLVGLGVWQEGSFELISPFEARYRLMEGAIEIAVDVRNGKVFKLTACAGYKGKLFGKITVGMSVRQAMALEPSLYYDEAEELILCKGIKGLSIDVPEVDPPPDKVPGMLIHAISVYAEEIMTGPGQKGDW